MDIESAIRLIPEGWGWSCGSGNVAHGSRAWANIWPETQPFPASWDFFEEGDSVADAIELAATRVRALIHDES